MDQVSMVFQKVYLFADTIENNICLLYTSRCVEETGTHQSLGHGRPGHDVVDAFPLRPAVVP